MLTSFADDEALFASIMAGAAGYVLKQIRGGSGPSGPSLVAEGRTNGQIAAELGLAEKTVKNYVSAVLGKLEVARRAEAAAYLARHTTLPGT